MSRRSCAAACALLAALAGCTDPSLPELPRCGAARRLDDGSCCAPLESARGDACAPRAFGPARALDRDGDGASSLALAADGRGHALLAFARAGRVVVAEDDAGEVSTTLGPALDGSPHLLDLAAGPAGEAALMWRQAGFYGADVGAVFVAHRSAGGALAFEPAPVSTTQNAYGPRAAIGPSGDALLVFDQWTGEHFAVAFATPADLATRPRFVTDQAHALSPATFFANSPFPAVGARGDLLVSWYQSPGGALMTYVSERRGRTGELSRPAPEQFVSAPGAPVDSHPIANPKPAIAADGQAAVVWTQEDGAGHVSTYLATRDADGRWYRPRDLRDRLDAGVGYARCAQLVWSQAGDLLVTWERDATIEVAGRLADGSWLRPKGAPETVSTAGHTALDPVLAAGADGGVLLVYRETDESGSFRVLARRWCGAHRRFEAPERIGGDAGAAGAPLVAMGGPDDRAVIAWLVGSDDGASVRWSTLEP